MIAHKNNYFVLTGAPGVGKTTLIKELRLNGHLCIDEPARQILAEQRAINGSGTPDKDPKKFTELLLDHSIKSYTDHLKSSNTIIFDRGVVDSIGYSSLFGIDTTEFVKKSKNYRYNKNVFVLSPWEEIYTTDDERKMSFADTLDFHEKILQSYRELDYDLIFVPQVTVSLRCQFMIERIRMLTK